MVSFISAAAQAKMGGAQVLKCNVSVLFLIAFCPAFLPLTFSGP